MKLIENGKLIVGVNVELFKEYRTVVDRKITEGRGTSLDASYIIGVLGKKSVYPRMLVDPERYSHHKKDDILYNGLSTAYLISNNLNHVYPSKLLRPSSYQKTLTPSDFLADLRRQGII